MTHCLKVSWQNLSCSLITNSRKITSLYLSHLHTQWFGKTLARLHNYSRQHQLARTFNSVVVCQSIEQRKRPLEELAAARQFRLISDIQMATERRMTTLLVGHCVARLACALHYHYDNNNNHAPRPKACYLVHLASLAKRLAVDQ